MKPFKIVIASAIAVSTLLSGCATQGSRSNSYASPQAYDGYGVVEAIDTVRSDGIGAGAIIGGVVGGVLGHQVGGGRGKDAATVVGAVGGAVVGNEIEKNNRSNESYRIRVRMDNGGYQTIDQANADGLRSGDRVQVQGSRVYAVRR